MSLIRAYHHLHKATQTLVKHYSPYINLNYLKLSDDATESEINKNMEELKKYYFSPEYSYLIYDKMKNEKNSNKTSFPSPEYSHLVDQKDKK